MDVHFKHGPSDEQGKQIARLWLNEDGDLGMESWILLMVSRAAAPRSVAILGLISWTVTGLRRRCAINFSVPSKNEPFGVLGCGSCCFFFLLFFPFSQVGPFAVKAC